MLKRQLVAYFRSIFAPKTNRPRWLRRSSFLPRLEDLEDRQLFNTAPFTLDFTHPVFHDCPELIMLSGGDADFDGLTYSVVSGPSHGSVIVDGGEVITYTPDPGFLGTDTLTFKNNDGELDSNVSTLTLTIYDHAPIAIADGYEVVHDSALSVTSILDNDTDPDNETGLGMLDTLSAVLDSTTSYGDLTLTSDGSFVYTPDPGFVGIDRFVYKASDGALQSTPTTVTLDVTNTPPIALDDEYNVTLVDDVVTIGADGGILQNDTDAEEDHLTASLVTGPSHGTVVLNADGSFTFSAGVGFDGEDSFQYKPNDGVADGNVAAVNIKAMIAKVTSITLVDGNVLPQEAQGFQYGNALPNQGAKYDNRGAYNDPLSQGDYQHVYWIIVHGENLFDAKFDQVKSATIDQGATTTYYGGGYQGAQTPGILMSLSGAADDHPPPLSVGGNLQFYNTTRVFADCPGIIGLPANGYPFKFDVNFYFWVTSIQAPGSGTKAEMYYDVNIEVTNGPGPAGVVKNEVHVASTTP